ncbi:hypothetical protein [Nostoc sp. FACHB-190]|uniref:hypothetical protein n=1 Tax=Nostoc sp. FACHB-190 TaxID=2692838 RepID=UPI001688F696|nr:hypothetical protein [Nostoc sp. FACHB-190]MBD2302267.1 hypothetical protein [Nostoc sp. FACHB-190]
MSDNIFFEALNALINNGCPQELAHSAASIVANDDPSKPDLGRTPEDQQIIQQVLPYLQKQTWNSTGVYDDYQTIDETPHPLAHGQFLANLGGLVPDHLIFALAEGEDYPFGVMQELGIDPDVIERAESIQSRLGEMNYWGE